MILLICYVLFSLGLGIFMWFQVKDDPKFRPKYFVPVMVTLLWLPLFLALIFMWITGVFE